MNMFFQISADTVGMTKNGAITSTRTMPCPQNGWSSSSASSMPPTTVIISTPSTRISVLVIAVQNAGSVGSSSSCPSRQSRAHRVQQVVVLEREPQRHPQWHEHPQQKRMTAGIIMRRAAERECMVAMGAFRSAWIGAPAWCRQRGLLRAPGRASAWARPAAARSGGGAITRARRTMRPARFVPRCGKDRPEKETGPPERTRQVADQPRVEEEWAVNRPLNHPRQRLT